MDSIAEFGWNLKSLFKKYQKWQILRSFDSLVLLTSFASDKSNHKKSFIFCTKTCFLGSS